MTAMPDLITERLLVRPFVATDLAAFLELLEVDPSQTDAVASMRRYLQWADLNHGALADVGQPPYGNRAVVHRESGDLVGSVGFVSALGPFGLLPGFVRKNVHEDALFTAEVGLYWAVSPGQRRRGFASEAAGALIRYGFDQLRLRCIVATTESDNVASIGVMRRLGMRIERNPRPEPEWFQVVGVAENDEA